MVNISPDLTEAGGELVTLTPLTIAALASAGAVLLAAFFAGLVSVITAWRTIAGKVSAIEGHVNSEKTAADGREAALRGEIILLREIITDLRSRAALLAQAASTAHIVGASSQSAIAPITEPIVVAKLTAEPP
jgi:hypothetical protein